MRLAAAVASWLDAPAGTGATAALAGAAATGCSAAQEVLQASAAARCGMLVTATAEAGNSTCTSKGPPSAHVDVKPAVIAAGGPVTGSPAAVTPLTGSRAPVPSTAGCSRTLPALSLAGMQVSPFAAAAGMPLPGGPHTPVQPASPRGVPPCAPSCSLSRSPMAAAAGKVEHSETAHPCTAATQQHSNHTGKGAATYGTGFGRATVAGLSATTALLTGNPVTTACRAAHSPGSSRSCVTTGVPQLLAPCATMLGTSGKVGTLVASAESLLGEQQPAAGAGMDSTPAAVRRATPRGCLST